jgi:hypothetical protein
MDSERRGQFRFEIAGELRGDVMVFQSMALREVSESGAQVELAFPLQLDSLHEFRLTLGQRSVVVKGRVAHCRVSDVDDQRLTYRAGIEFVDVSDHARAAISWFVGELKTTDHL